MRKGKKCLGFPSSQNKTLRSLARQCCFQRTVICNFAASWVNHSRWSQETLRLQKSAHEASLRGTGQQKQSRLQMTDAKNGRQMNETQQTSPKDLNTIELFMAKRKQRGSVMYVRKKGKKEPREGDDWLLSEAKVPRASEMSAQKYTSTDSLLATSLTTPLKIQPTPSWTLPLLNLSFHFTSTTTSWSIIPVMQTLKPHVCNTETTLWRAWKRNWLIHPRGRLMEAGVDQLYATTVNY